MKNPLNKIIQSLKAGLQSVFSSFIFSFLICWRSSKWLFTFRLFLEITLSLLPLIVIYLSKEVIDSLVNIISADSSDIRPLVTLILYLFIVEVINVASQKLEEILTGIHKDLISNYVNEQIIRKSAELDLSFFDSPFFYNSMLNVRRDSGSVETMVWSVTGVVKSSIQLLATGIILCQLSIFFPLLLICLNIPAVIIEKKFTEYIYNWMYNRAPEERKLSYIQQIMTDRFFAKEVKLFNLFQPFFNRYKIIWKLWFTEKQRIIKRKCFWAIFTSILPRVGLLFLTLFVVFRIVKKKLTIGDFAYYTGLGGQFTGSVYMLINSLSQIFDNKLRINNYKQFLGWEARIQNHSGKILNNNNPTIEFKDVSFQYPNTDYLILNKLNLIIDTREKTAIVGLNGAGKSTLVKLLLRLYDPTDGQVLIDNIDLREYDLNSVRRIFGVVFQDFANYAFTARENIGISDYDNLKDDSRIEYAAEMSSAIEFIKKWEKGFDTYLTKQFEVDGHELSGGEWQKMALARAFFRDAPVMIMDEPSSNLDPEAEYQVFQNFATLCSDKGAIFISHRLSSIVMTNKIVVLENGKIIESGTHNELMDKNGKYAYLFNLQAEKYKI
jgi:ATP-binding cassette, subfamily B, bacterial